MSCDRCGVKRWVYAALLLVLLLAAFIFVWGMIVLANATDQLDYDSWQGRR